MDRDEKINLAAWFARAAVLDSGYIRQSCIASAKATTEILKRLDVKAYPVTCSFAAMTPPWFEAFEEGTLPQTEAERDKFWEEERGWSVGCFYDPTPSENAWNAHCVVIADNGRFLVDASGDQYARPERDLPLEPIVAPIPDDNDAFLNGRQQLSMEGRKDEDSPPMMLIYSLFPSVRSFTQSPDWTRWLERFGPACASAVKTIRSMEAGEIEPYIPELPDAPDDPTLVARMRPEEQRKRQILSEAQLRAHTG